MATPRAGRTQRRDGVLYPGVNKDATLKHEYPKFEWVLVPLGHWNWKWNSARANYNTYEQELLGGCWSYPPSIG